MDSQSAWWLSAITAQQLDTLSFRPLAYLVDRLLVAGGVVLLSSPPKLGKSLLSLGVAAAIASGEAALGGGAHAPGLATLPAAVLYVSLDDTSPRRAQRRLRAVLRGRSVPPGLTLHFADIGRGPLAAANLIAYLDAHPETRLVIIDTLQYVRADAKPGESAYAGDVRAMQALRTVVEAHPGVTLLCLTHTRKDDRDDDSVAATTGTYGVTGGADAVLTLSGDRRTPRRLLEVVSRDDDECRHILTIGAHGLELTGDDPDDPAALLSPDDARLYRKLRDFEAGASAKDLELELFPDPPTRIGDRMSRLSKKGVIRRLGRGQYGTW